MPGKNLKYNNHQRRTETPKHVLIETTRSNNDRVHVKYEEIKNLNVSNLQSEVSINQKYRKTQFRKKIYYYQLGRPSGT